MSRAVSLVVVAGCFSTPARPTGDGGPPGDAVDGPVTDVLEGPANLMFEDPKTLAVSTENCNNWTPTPPGLMTNLGRSTRSSPMAFKGYTPLACGDFQRVYCFQTDP